MSENKFIFTVIALAVVSVLLFAIFGSKSGETSGLLGTEYSNEGQEHVDVGQSHAPYKTNPPLSGPHYTSPASWNFYDKILEDEQVLHNLEHGGIWISYQKELSADEKSQLETLSKKYPDRLVVSFRPKNDSAFVVASWRRMEKLETLDLALMEQFLKNNVNNSPEKTI